MFHDVPYQTITSIEIDHDEVTTTNLLSWGRYYNHVIINRHRLLSLSTIVACSDSAISAAAADRPFETK